MMQMCGGCTAQQVSQVAQIIINPVTWLIVIAAVTSVVSKKKKS